MWLLNNTLRRFLYGIGLSSIAIPSTYSHWMVHTTIEMPSAVHLCYHIVPLQSWIRYHHLFLVWRAIKILETSTDWVPFMQRMIAHKTRTGDPSWSLLTYMIWLSCLYLCAWVEAWISFEACFGRFQRALRWVWLEVEQIKKIDFHGFLPIPAMVTLAFSFWPLSYFVGFLFIAIFFIRNWSWESSFLAFSLMMGLIKLKFNWFIWGREFPTSLVHWCQ